MNPERSMEVHSRSSAAEFSFSRLAPRWWDSHGGTTMSPGRPTPNLHPQLNQNRSPSSNLRTRGNAKGAVTVLKIQKSDAEWRKQLSADSFEVARHAETERAFTGSLLNVHDKGVFRCICCDTALFSSATKFDSGTGWPSFWAPIAKENIVESSDNSFGMERTAVSCRRCDAHLGHVFDDGPRPTGLRYCMNSVAMRFAKA